jgi:hypothetical protein
MANPKNGLGFLHSVIASGGSGPVLFSRFVRRNESQQTSTEILLCRLTSAPHPTLLARALEGSRLGADLQYLTDELCLASAEHGLQIIGTQKEDRKPLRSRFLSRKQQRRVRLKSPRLGRGRQELPCGIFEGRRQERRLQWLQWRKKNLVSGDQLC